MGTFSDDFSDGSLDANFTTDTNASGAITESLANSRLECRETGGTVSDAYLFYFNALTIDKNASWTLKWKADGTTPTSPNNFSHVKIGLWDDTSAPACAAAAVNYGVKFRIEYHTVSGWSIRIMYRNSADTTNYYWNGSSWTTTASSYAITVDTTYTFIMTCDGTNITMTVKNSDESSTLFGPATIAHASCRLNQTLYATAGEDWTNVYATFNTNFYYFEYTGPGIGADEPLMGGGLLSGTVLSGGSFNNFGGFGF
jgi:hypothetical protein